MEEKKEPLKKREAKFLAIKEKKKNKPLPNLFTHRISDKSDAGQVSGYINTEIDRHTSYTKAKRAQNEIVMKAIEKFEAKKTLLIDNSAILPHIAG